VKAAHAIPQLTGSFWLVYLFDIAEAADLEQARKLCGADVQAGPF